MTQTPARKLLVLAGGEAKLDWLGRFSRRVGPNQEAYFGLLHVGRVPLLLESVTVHGRWLALSLNLLSPCCHSTLDPYPKAEQGRCGEVTCGQIYAVHQGHTILNGDDEQEERINATVTSLAPWAEHFGYAPLEATLVAATVSDLRLRTLVPPLDLPEVDYSEAFRLTKLRARTHQKA